MFQKYPFPGSRRTVTIFSLPGLLSLMILTALTGPIFSNHGQTPQNVPPEARYYERAGLWVLEKNGTQTVWFGDGTLKARGGQERGQREGKWDFWYPGGNQKAEGFYEHNLRTGHWKLYYENGHLKAEGDYRESKRHGVWTEFYDNGQVEMKGNYTMGVKDGEWVNYYENGQLFYSGVYHNDQADGPWKFFFRNGSPYQSGSYEKDVRVGTWNICVQPVGPCETKIYPHNRVPRRTGLPPADMRGNAPTYDPSNPAGLLDSMDTGGVPDEIPLDSLKGNQGWEER